MKKKLQTCHSVMEAAKALNLSRQTIYDLIAKDELRTFTVGRRRLISDQAITDFIEAREAESAQPGTR